MGNGCSVMLFFRLMCAKAISSSMSVGAPVSMIILVLTLLFFTSTVEILDLSLPFKYKYSSSLQLDSLSSSLTTWTLFCCPRPHFRMTPVLHILAKWFGFSHFLHMHPCAGQELLYVAISFHIFDMCWNVNACQEVLCEDNHYHVWSLGVSCSVI